MRYYEIIRATLEEAKARRPNKPLVPAQSSNPKPCYPAVSAVADIFRPSADAEPLMDQANSCGMHVKNGL